MTRKILSLLLVFCLGQTCYGARALKLRESPRLFPCDMATLNTNLHSQFLQDLAKKVIIDADILAESDPIAEKEVWNYLSGSRQIRGNISTLTGAWALTHGQKYRDAAIRYLGSLTNWNHISCEANRSTPPDRDMFFCLMYGEQSAEIGIMYDLFRPDMTPEEKAVFMAVFDRFHLKEAFEAMKRPPWWVNKDWSNWNGVCAGGMGILALAVYDDIPKARKIIPFVEKSLGEYFKSFIKNGGGCHEGTGYWNYGMTYAARYLLFWEHATGKKHPAFEIKELGKSLYFPLDFTGLNFGDNDGWGPLGFYFRLAERVNEPEAALRAAARLPNSIKLTKNKRRAQRSSTWPHLLYAASAIPTTNRVAEFVGAHREKKVPAARVYDGLGWAILADDEVSPSLRLAARGGRSEITGHGMLDLLSFKCRVNGKLMITDQVDGYNAVTFTGRGADLYTRRAASKSTLFVDGLGCEQDVECEVTEVVKGDGLLGIRIDGSGIYMPRWRGNMFIGRLFLMVESRYWLVIDHVYSPYSSSRHWAESRFHTFAETEKGDDWVSLKVGDQQMMMTFAALGRSVMQTSKGLPFAPRTQTQIFRWMSSGMNSDNLHVAALNPGDEKLQVKVKQDTEAGGYAVKVTGTNDYSRIIKFSPKLILKP